MRLAGQYEACIGFPWFEREVDFHRRGAFGDAGAAGAAHAAAAGPGEIKPGPDGGFEDGFAGGDRDEVGLAVVDDGGGGKGGGGGGGRGTRAAVGDGGGELSG